MKDLNTENQLDVKKEDLIDLLDHLYEHGDEGCDCGCEDDDCCCHDDECTCGEHHHEGECSCGHHHE